MPDYETIQMPCPCCGREATFQVVDDTMNFTNDFKYIKNSPDGKYELYAEQDDEEAGTYTGFLYALRRKR